MIEPAQFVELETQGYAVLANVIEPELISRFEEQVAVLVDAQLNALGIEPRHPDPFVDLFSVGGAYTEQLYELMERMQVLAEMAEQVGQAVERDGFLAHFGFKVPLVWPDIRCDLPGTTRLLPVHQDYKSTRCHRAFRFWVPLRPSDEFRGTMCAWPGTHVTGPVPHDAIDRNTPAIAPDRYAGVEPVVFSLPAGDAVVFSSMLFHASVPNRSQRTKFTLMVQVQDLSTMSDPRDQTFASFREATVRRSGADVGVIAGPERVER